MRTTHIVVLALAALVALSISAVVVNRRAVIWSHKNMQNTMYARDIKDIDDDVDSQNSKVIKIHLNRFTAEGEASYFAVRDSSGYIDHYRVGPIKKNSIMRYGSITKIFNAYFALKSGLDLDSHPSAHFSPDQYAGSDVMTYRDVLSHQSGIPEYATLENLLNSDQTDWVIPGGAFTVAADIDIGWKNESLDFAPGSKYCYSNTNFEVAGKTTEIISGKNVGQHIVDTFHSTLRLDDGTTPLADWPQTVAYLNWPYPPTLPGVSGTLIGTAKDLLDAFGEVAASPQFPEMNNWSNVTERCDAPGASIVGGVKYGIGYQMYSPCQIYGGATGHDGDLIARSLLIKHPSGNTFLYHYTNSISNDELIQRMNVLVTDYLL